MARGEKFGGYRRNIDAVALMAACAQILAIAAVFFNIFGWTLIATSQIADGPTSITNTVLADASSICTQSRSDDSGQKKHQICPQCFPLSNSSAGALAPSLVEIAFVATASVQIVLPRQDVSRLSPRYSQQPARAPPFLS